MKILFGLFAFACALTVNAQNYLISFAGSGASSTVSSVKVENLTQGTTKTLTGTDILHLVGIITGIDPIVKQPSKQIRLFPNPMVDYTNLQFDIPKAGKVVVSLHDISGKVIMQTQDNLVKGQHTYKIQGLDKGVYIVTVKTSGSILTGRLLSQGLKGNVPNITRLNSVLTQEEKTGGDVDFKEKEDGSKGVATQIEMQYSSGDRLRLTGVSDIYTTIIVDVPTTSKLVTFTFIACTDGEGNNYPVIQIGTGKSAPQYWMATNLKSTKFNDGTVIPLVSDNTAWSKLNTYGYCWYNNDISNKATYGALYNWYTVNTGKLCPTGWHAPTLDEWKTLTDFLGGSNAAGGKLKETGTTHWISPNKGATNEIGFTALPGGYRSSNGTFYYMGSYCKLWLSTKSDDTNSFCQILNNNCTAADLGALDNKSGLLFFNQL